MSRLSREACARLGVTTVAELCAKSQLEFIDAAYACARDDQRVAPALAEVSQLLSLHCDGAELAREEPEPFSRTVADDGAALEDLAYLGTFRAGATLCLGEQRFIARTGDRLLVLLDVEPGLWDAHATSTEFRKRGLLLVHRDVAPEASPSQEGALTLPDPKLVIVDAELRRHDHVRRLVRSRSNTVFDWGLVPVLAHGDGYRYSATRGVTAARIARIAIDVLPLVRDAESDGDGGCSGETPRTRPTPPRDGGLRRDEAPAARSDFKKGDRVKVKKGPLNTFEGEVVAVDETSGRVTVAINLFDRMTPVDLDPGEIERA